MDGVLTRKGSGDGSQSKVDYNFMMISYKEVDTEDQGRWDSLAAHPLQSWAWGDFRKTRQLINRLGIYENGFLVRGFLIVWSKLYFLPWYIGYIPMGPFPTAEDLKEITKLAKSRKALMVRMEPCKLLDQVSRDENKILGLLTKGRSLFKPKTYWINLRKTESQLLEGMHSKARYNIRIATKHGVLVKENNTEEGLENFIKLLFEGTAKRQKIYTHDHNYHRNMWKILNSAGIVNLFEAVYENQVLSAWIVMKWNESIYYAYGANSLLHKEVMASTLLLWEVVKWGAVNRFGWFDLWGAEEGKGFSRFKEQFNPELKENIGTFDISVDTVAYRVFRVMEEVRWKWLRAIK